MVPQANTENNQPADNENNAVSAFTDMIMAEDGISPEEEKKKENQGDKEDSLTNDEDIEAETDEEGDSEEVDGIEEEVEEEQAEETEEAEEATVAVNLGGKEYQVTPEVAEAYKLMEKDYTQKTMDVAEQRKSLEVNISQFQQQSQQFNTIAAFIFEDLQKPIATLEEKQRLHAEGDTDRLQEIILQEEAQKQKLSDFTARAQQVGNILQQQEQSQVMQKRKACALELQRTAPELLKEETVKANTEFLRKFGVSNERMQQIVEPEVFKIIDMARQFEELSNKRENLKKEVKKAPKTLKNKGRVNKKSANRANLDAAKNKAKKTGDATDFFLTTLMNEG